MKTLINFYTSTPSYFKRDAFDVVVKTKLQPSTVDKFRASVVYKEMKKAYLKSLK
jgi:hypothetical protein